jgi:lauroyl/myristoyl acyltransferase
MTTTEERVAALRARVPNRWVPALAAARARADWRREAVREDARAQMTFVLEHARPDADLDAAARAYVQVQALRGELRWHPDLLTSLRVEGIEHLRAAQAQGHGVVLSFLHHGYYDGAFPSIARLGFPGHLVAYPYMLTDEAPLWLRQHVVISCLNGGTPVSAAVGVEGMTAILEQGGILALATDVPGRTPVRFLGRDVLGSFGAPRIAAGTGAPMVALTTEWDERGVHVRLHPPIESRGVEPRELLDQVLAVHEPVLLRWPEQTDIPLARWGVPEPAEPAEAARG